MMRYWGSAVAVFWGVCFGILVAATGQAYDNLALGVPGTCDQIVDRESFALGYSEKYEQPLWVIYKLTRREVTTYRAQRTNKFRDDPAIVTGSATATDYRRSGYDRGHLAPAADMRYSRQAMHDSFYFSNMSPQRPQFNRGIWKDLEHQVRLWARQEHHIYVVTGPIFAGQQFKTIGANHVAVPTHYYKIVYDVTPPQKMVAFILPNCGSSRPLSSYVVTVDEVEKLTGLDFFNALPEAVQRDLESTRSLSAWF